MANKKNTGVNPAVAAVAGAVIGAGVAVAGAAAMQDKKTRTKVKKVIDGAKNGITEYAKDVEVPKKLKAATKKKR